jgi:hypothetical protein
MIAVRRNRQTREQRRSRRQQKGQRCSGKKGWFWGVQQSTLYSGVGCVALSDKKPWRAPGIGQTMGILLCFRGWTRQGLTSGGAAHTDRSCLRRDEVVDGPVEGWEWRARTVDSGGMERVHGAVVLRSPPSSPRKALPSSNARLHAALQLGGARPFGPPHGRARDGNDGNDGKHTKPA